MTIKENMNSFKVNTLPYKVNTLFAYKTSDKYKGFIVRVMCKCKNCKCKPCTCN